MTPVPRRPAPVRLLGPVAAGRGRPWPGDRGPEARCRWRQDVAADVEDSLRALWDRTIVAVGLDGADGGDAAVEEVLRDGGAAGTPGLALACVGSLARREIGPASDLDLVLLHDSGAAGIGPEVVEALAEQLWYPVWDAGIGLDHSVRSVQECRTVAGADLPAAVGLLDLRHLAGDARLTRTCATEILVDWRRATRRRLPDLAEDAAERAGRHGDLAGLLEPDLKEAHGGLRDAVLVRALAASSLADRPHGDFDEAVALLLDVRDALAVTTGRRANRLLQADQDAVAARLGIGSGSCEPRDELLMRVHKAGRLIASALETTMRSALRTARPARRPLTLVRFGRRSAPILTRLDDGVVLVGEEVALADDADPAGDPALPLRLALAAARTGRGIAPVTRAGLGRCPAPSAPWSRAPARRPGGAVPPDGIAGSCALDLLIELLGSGRALVRIWEDLDAAGLPGRWWPGWESVRGRPQRNPVHLYTVDRHMVRTAVAAAGLLDDPATAAVLADLGLPGVERSSSTADRRVLLLAALLHDLGKAIEAIGPDHAAEGARRAGPVLEVLGVDAGQSAEIILLVRHHLLLSRLAASAPGAREAVEAVHRALGTGPGCMRRLALARLLAQADACATGPRAWTPWRRSVLDQAVRAATVALA